ncbi:MAG: hypothetical protein WC683_15160 [bacterium]
MPKSKRQSISIRPQDEERWSRFAEGNNYPNLSELIRVAVNKLIDEEEEDARISRKVRENLDAPTVREELKQIARDVYWQVFEEMVRDRQAKNMEK